LGDFAQLKPITDCVLYCLGEGKDIDQFRPGHELYNGFQDVICLTKNYRAFDAPLHTANMDTLAADQWCSFNEPAHFCRLNETDTDEPSTVLDVTR